MSGALRTPDGQLLGKAALREAAKRAARDALRTYLAATGVQYQAFQGALVVVAEAGQLTTHVVDRAANHVATRPGLVAHTLWRALAGLGDVLADDAAGIVGRAVMSDGKMLGVRRDRKDELAAIKDVEQAGAWLEAHGVPLEPTPRLDEIAGLLTAIVAELARTEQEVSPRLRAIEAALRLLSDDARKAHEEASKPRLVRP